MIGGPRTVGMRGLGSSPGLSALMNIADQLRGDLFVRYMGLAQRRALTWWRDRRTAPGLAARMTTSGATFYGFGRRSRKPYTIAPYYYVTGGLQRAMAARRPKTRRTPPGSPTVTTVLAFGGSTLNFLGTTGKPDQRPVVSWTRQTRTLNESFSVGSYTRSSKQGAVTVSGYSVTRTRTVSRNVPQRGGQTYAQAWGNFAKDAPVIQARVLVEFRRLVQRLAVDKRTGLIRPNFMQEAA